jgi:hypothetical protein
VPKGLLGWSTPLDHRRVAVRSGLERSLAVRDQNRCTQEPPGPEICQGLIGRFERIAHRLRSHLNLRRDGQEVTGVLLDQICDGQDLSLLP